MTYRAVFAAIASPVAPVSPVNYIADQGAHWSTSSTTIGRARLVPKTYLMEGISGVSGLVASAQFQGASAFFTLPAEISTPGLIIKGPPSLPHKIFVNGVESNTAVAGATVEIRANQRSDITQPEYPITVGLNTVIAYADTTPNAFTVPDMFGCAIGSEHTTETITPTGFDNAVVSGTGFALINGIRVMLPATIMEGATLAFVFTQTDIEQTNTVHIGNVSSTFYSFRDKPAVLTPISMFHIAYARSGVTYTSGLIRNDTGQEVEVTVTNGTIVGNKTKLADQETCELEFMVPAGTGHHTVTLSSGKAKVEWKIWKDAAYLDPWISVAGNTGSKTESLPLSFASIPKPAKMSIYFPSGIDAKVNGTDVNSDETYAGLDASSMEIEITTDDVVVIAGYPNFAPKRVRVGSVYATWLLFPADGDPTCIVPYYDPTYLQNSIPIRLNSVTYSLMQKGSVSNKQETSPVQLGGMPLVSSQSSYIETLNPNQARDSNAVISARGLIYIDQTSLPVPASRAVHRKQNSTEAYTSTPIYIEHYLDRPDLGVFEYRHQNCEVVDSVDGDYVCQNLSRPETPTPEYDSPQYSLEISSSAPVKIDTAFIEVPANAPILVSKEAYSEIAPDAVNTKMPVLSTDCAVGFNSELNQSSFSTDACTYAAHFMSSALEAKLMAGKDYTADSLGTNKGTVYSHAGGMLEINFIEATSLYHIPMVSMYMTGTQHSVNLVSHWQSPEYYSSINIPVLTNLVTYTSSNEVLYKADSGYMFSHDPIRNVDQLHVIESEALSVSDFHNTVQPKVLYKQDLYQTVQSRSKLISAIRNVVESRAANHSEVTYSIDLAATVVEISNKASVSVSALRTQENHSIYMPDFSVFESFYADESAVDVAHGYFDSSVDAMRDGTKMWGKKPYEIAPYGFKDKWIWITPVYGFDLCSPVPMYGYIRGG